MFKLNYLALLCLLAGCAGAAPQASCIRGNPGGSFECQAGTYRLVY